MKWGEHPFEDPGLATFTHLRDSEEKHGLRSVPAPSAKVRRLDESLKWVQRLLAGYAAEAHTVRQPKAAEILEMAEETVEEARKELAKR